MGNPYKKGGKRGGGVAKAVKHASPCKYFQRGKCSNPNCPYLHVKGRVAGVVSSASPTSVAAGTDVILTVLKLFFEKHQLAIYNADARMLDLNALATKAELATISSSVNFNHRNFCEALCQCITSCILPPPSILALEENGITAVYHLARAMEETNMHKSLQALSLAHNDIKTCDFAKEMKDFTSLVELNLLGNPATALTDYKQKVKKFLPSLVLLDTEPLSAAPLALPWPVFYDVSQAVGSATGTAATPGRAQAYDSVQKDILHFIQTALLNPLEQEPGAVPSGTITGVDAVCEAYALQACLSVSLSCPEASVATPPSTASAGAGGANGGGDFRNMVREVVGFRIRQSESDHNLVRGGGGAGTAGRLGRGRAAQVASGRTQVCAQLEHLLYPKTFAVGHYIHASPDVAVLDNNGMGPDAPAQFKAPVSVVTLHGVMVWRYRPDGPNTQSNNAKNASHGGGGGGGVFRTLAAAAAAEADRGVVLIKRNFSRVLTVTVSGSESRWQIVNDMVTLYPFSGTAAEEDDGVATAAAMLHSSPAMVNNAPGGSGSGAAGQLQGTGPSLEGGMFADLNPYDVVFSPATDPKRANAMARTYQVPIPVVALVTKAVSNDAELAVVLADVQGVPLEAFEECAALAGGDAMGGVFLCRLQRRYGVEAATTGLQLLSQFGLNWAAIQAALQPQS